MGRKKKSEGGEDTLEQLEQEVRKLKSENRHLHKELKRSNKKYKPHHDKEELLEEEHREKNPLCEQCGKGNIKSTDLGVRKLVSCTVCTFRKTLKK
jgi:predicted  nucleic acid-binding Zn-ribbon protein